VKRLGFCLSLLLALNICAQDAAWYKGNLHMHTVWSDGGVFPEEAVDYYRSRGYHFLCLSDHNQLQINPANWVEIGGTREPSWYPKITPAALEQYLKAFGDTADKKTEDDKDFVRLKTIGELKQQFDKEGQFLLVPGHEINRSVGGIEVHMNAINISRTFPFATTTTVHEAFAKSEKAVTAHGKENNIETLFMLNHPFWRYFDVQPETLIQLPQIRFYELANGGGGGNVFPAHPDWYSLEKFWDVANAFRISAGHPPVYGVATDDTHGYGSPDNVTRGWVYVRAPKLDCDTLVQAMNRGDFYSSCGVVLKDVRFDVVAGTLTVEVDPKANEAYEVAFIVTRADFDRTTSSFDDPAEDKKPARKGLKYSDTIGVVAKKESGFSASYTMQPNDLYVRATITSSTKIIKGRLTANSPVFETAWTQPYGWQQWQQRNVKK